MKSSIVKISRPRITKAYPRERLFNLLENKDNRPVIWISAPAGSGKTTLVASWLEARKHPCLWYHIDEGDRDIGTFFYYLGLAMDKAFPKNKDALPLLSSEYLQGIRIFSRRYFEEMFRKLGIPYILVIDDYQEVGTNPEINEIISEGLAVMPPGITAVIISRTDPPPAFSRLLANGSLFTITWNDIKLTIDESIAIMNMRNDMVIGKNTVKMLHKKTQGWAAGLILITESMRVTDGEALLSEKLNIDEIFDYFASEIFDKSGPDERHFLMKTSFLPYITHEAAVEMTGNQYAVNILKKLYRENYFTQMDYAEKDEYHYHPLFRDFLRNRTEKFYKKDELSDIMRRSAALMLSSGNIEDAANLFINTGDWKELTELCLTRAKSLISQGRAKTLAAWIDKLPESLVSESGQLLYWKGVSCMSFDPAGSRAFFEKAARIFENTGDRVWTLLSASSAIDAIIFEWSNFTHLDRWIATLNRYIESSIDHLPPEIKSRVTLSMAFAQMVRRPDSPDIGDWISGTIDLFRSSADINLRIQAYILAINYFFWTGNQARGRLLLEDIKDLANSESTVPLLKLTWFWTRASKQMWEAAPPGNELKKDAINALAYARETGVNIWDHMLYAIAVYAFLAQGDLEGADDLLSRMKLIADGRRSHIESHYHYLCALRYHIDNNSSMALAHGETSLEIAEETGFVFPYILCLFEMAQLLNNQGKTDEAERHIDKAAELSIRTRSPIFQFVSLLTKAQIAFKRGNEETGLSHLAEALAIGNEKEYFNLLWWYEPSEMAKLCEKAVMADIEPGYVQKMIRIHRLQPPGDSMPDNWPWPVKILTLGRFDIVISGKIIKSSGKIQQKPLALLKTIIALGGKEVPENPVSDSLWPDANGDAAHKSFEMNVIRLRKLLGDKETVILSGSKVTLNPKLCWVDTWMLERAISDSESAWISFDNGTATGTEVLELTDLAISLYSGSFLPNDDAYALVLSFRDRLTGRILRLILLCAGYYELRKKWGNALSYLEKALSLDNLSEDIYQRIMVCNLRMGRSSEAIRIYHRCRENLFAAFGINPSQKTEKIAQNILKSV